jgi:L-fuconolactonase
MPPGDGVLRRAYLPDALKPILERNRFEGSIAIQASTAVEETRWLLELASANDFIRGVVGWVDLTDPHVGATLDELQKHPKFKGIRHPVHDEPDASWLVRDDVLRGLAELARRGIPYDLLLRPLHLPLIPRIADRVPDLRMVIDHLAKPLIRDGAMDPWAADMEVAAKLPQVYCKISGMITEADPANWNSQQLAPYIAHVMHRFGPDRLMFGSDWPVCLSVGTWKQVLAAFTQGLGAQTVGVREKLLGQTAAQFYGITD